MLKEETLPLLCMFLPPGTKPPPARTMRMTGDKVLPSSSGLPPQSQSGGRDDESEGEGGGGGGQRTSGPRRQSEQGGGGRKPIRHIAGRRRSAEAKKAFLSLFPSWLCRRPFCAAFSAFFPLAPSSRSFSLAACAAPKGGRGATGAKGAHSALTPAAITRRAKMSLTKSLSIFHRKDGSSQPL